MEWMLASSLAMGMALVGVFGTYFWLRAARIPSDIALALSPCLTILLISGTGQLWHLLGWPFGPATVLPFVVLVGAAGWLVARRWVPPRSQSLGWQFWVMVGIGWLVAALPWMLAAGPYNPVQQWDPSFHMNGVWSIVTSGDAGWTTGLMPNSGNGEASDYPIGWHAFVSAFSTKDSVVFSANASSLALMLLWVTSAAVYTKTLFRSRIAWTVAPLLAGGMLSMPADALGAYSQWPNATAVAVMPGIAAFAVWFGRRFVSSWETNSWSPKYIPWTVVLALSLVGGLFSHPSLAFNLFFLLAPALVAGGYSLMRFDIHRRRVLGILLWPVAGIAVLALVIAVYMTPEIRHMGGYPRGGQSWQVALGHFLTPSPPYAPSVSMSLAVIVIAVLMSLGLTCYVFTRLQGRSIPAWPFWSFLLFSVLVLIAFGPDSSFREFIVAPWFLDSRRIMEPQNLTMVPLAALGFAWMAGVLRTALNLTIASVSAVLAAVVLVASGGFGFTARFSAAQGVYDPNLLGKPGMATADELEMLRSLDEILPEEAVILGDPQNGSVYAQMIGGRRVVFPQLTLGALSADKQVLVDSFKDIQTNPEVCKAVDALGVTHFYADEDGYYYQTLRSDRTPGLYNVDTSTGFELVASGDTARLYRITACD